MGGPQRVEHRGDPGVAEWHRQVNAASRTETTERGSAIMNSNTIDDLEERLRAACHAAIPRLLDNGGEARGSDEDSAPLQLRVMPATDDRRPGIDRTRHQRDSCRPATGRHRSCDRRSRSARHPSGLTRIRYRATIWTSSSSWSREFRCQLTHQPSSGRRAPWRRASVTLPFAATWAWPAVGGEAVED